MKIYCIKCGHDISASVDRNFLDYKNGKVVCPKCQKHQDRYISESDLFLFLLVYEITYLLLCGITVAFYLLLSRSIFVLLLLVPFLFINVYIIREIERKIYINGFPKSKFKNYSFTEDTKAIKTGIKYRAIIFFTISVSLLTLAENKLYLLLYIFISILETFLRYIKVYNREKAIASSKINYSK